MKTARNHHFISQCYLKRFTRAGTKNSQLFAINLADGSTFWTKPKNVGVERDFNRVSGNSPGELDAAFSAFESIVDVALDRIHCSRRIDDQHNWSVLLNLVALFAARHLGFEPSSGIS
jgi:Protein of unknown function (DUF4238)